MSEINTNNPPELSGWERKPEVTGFPPDIEKEFGEDIASLTPEQKAKLAKQWATETQQNSGTFLTLLDTVVREEKVSEEKTQVSEEKTEDSTERQDAAKRDSQAEQRDSQELKSAENRKELRETTKAAQKHIADIETKVWSQYRSEIDGEMAKLQTGQVDPETSDFLKNAGIDASKPDALQAPEVASILSARIATKVYLSHRADIEKSHPDLKGSMENLDSLRFKLGIKETAPAKELSRLLVDQPKEIRAKASEAIKSLPGVNEKTLVSREGNILRVLGPDGKTATHELTLSDPPELVKRQGRILEARRTIREKPDAATQERDERREQSRKEMERDAGTLKADAHELTAWKAPEDASEKEKQELASLSNAELEASAAALLDVIQKKPFDASRLQKTLDAHRVLVADRKERAEKYIEAGKGGEYPDNIEEEARRRGIVDRPLELLSNQEQIVHSIELKLSELASASSERPKGEVATASNKFEANASYNLRILEDLGFDRLDSMADASKLLMAADRKARSESWTEFARTEDGSDIDLGTMVIDRESRKALISTVYGLLESKAGNTGELQNNKAPEDQYRAIRDDLSLGQDSRLLKNYRLMKLENGGGLPSAESMAEHLGGTRAFEQPQGPTEGK